MNRTDKPLSVPSRILYAMFRVRDLERSIAFYRDTLGMSELRRETFTQGRFTLVFIGYGNETSNAVIELTHNWDTDAYEHGTGFGHVALEVADMGVVCDRFTKMGVRIVRAPGPMKYAADEAKMRENIAFIEDPDGYRIELVEKRLDDHHLALER